MKFDQSFLDGCARCSHNSGSGMFSDDVGFTLGVGSLNGKLALLQGETMLPMSEAAQAICGASGALAINNEVVYNLQTYTLKINNEGMLDLA